MREKDSALKAANAEKFLNEHKDADPSALTAVYKALFQAYADSGWPKVLQTYDRSSVAPRLTDADKQRLEEIVKLARDRNR